MEQSVNQYRLVRKLGSGGMGEVYLAEDTRLKRNVALKFLPDHLSQDPDFKARFEHEAQAVAALDHPNIISIHELGEHNGRLYIAMQYLDGRTLQEMLDTEEISLKDALKIVEQICSGLVKAHEEGVIHRDIKPANIFVTNEGAVKILDFGLAKSRRSTTQTKTGTTVGTLQYESPEQCRGEKVDRRSDIFSVGVLLYQLITGRLPFTGDYDAAIVYAISHETPDPIARYKSGATDELQRIVDKALTKEPERRYQHADDMLVELRRLHGVTHQDTGESNLSIAVLPFVNMSDDQGNEYFSDGLTEELINALVKVPNLHVAARTSVFQFKGITADVDSIGRKLRVARVLEGSVRKAGNKVRVTAQLIDVSNGFHLWSEKYDRSIDDIFAIQDEISQSVATALQVVLTKSNGDSCKSADKTEVHNLILEGMHFLRQGRWKSSLERALNCFERAIGIDQDSPQAWIGLAKTYNELVTEGDSQPDVYIEKARNSVERALALDESLVEAHCVSGVIKQYFDLDWSGADTEFRKALELEPGNAHAIRLAGRLAYATGNVDDAIALHLKGSKLDPLNAALFIDLGWSLLCDGRVDDALEAYQRGLELAPDRQASHHFMGRAYLLGGMPDLALEQMRSEPHQVWRLEGLALVYHALGERESATEALNELLDTSTGWEFNIAEVYAYWGEIDKSFEWLECAREKRDGGVGQFVKSDPLFANLHKDPRWNGFLEKIGLSD